MRETRSRKKPPDPQADVSLRGPSGAVLPEPTHLDRLHPAMPLPVIAPAPKKKAGRPRGVRQEGLALTGTQPAVDLPPTRRSRDAVVHRFSEGIQPSYFLRVGWHSSDSVTMREACTRVAPVIHAAETVIFATPSSTTLDSRIGEQSREHRECTVSVDNCGAVPPNS